MGIFKAGRLIVEETKRNRSRKPYINPDTQGHAATAGMRTEQNPNSHIDYHTPGAGSGQNDAMNYGNYTGEIGYGCWPGGPSGGVYFGPGERDE
jgi:hypothetical protein